MFYLKKPLVFISILNTLSFIITKYVSPIIILVITKLESLFPSMGLNTINKNIDIYSFKLFMISKQIFIILIVLLIAWLIINIISGQLLRDIYSSRLTKKLLRHVSDNPQQMIAKEENKANFWIKKGRITKKKGKLIFRIPCASNESVFNIIDQRSASFTSSWLQNTYKNVNWLPTTVTHNIFFSWLVIKEK